MRWEKTTEAAWGSKRGGTAVVLQGGRAVPDLDRPVGAAGDEDLRVVVVPGDAVDGHVVSLVCVEERARVRLGTDVQLALLRPDQVQVVLVYVEVERRAATSTSHRQLIGTYFNRYTESGT